MTTYSYLKVSSVFGVFALAGCGPTIPANSAYSAGHDIDTNAQLAQADLSTCKADNTKCDSLDKDLKAIDETAKGLQDAAIKSGYQPPTKTTAATP